MRDNRRAMPDSAYRFCPKCGGALETRLLRAGDPQRLVCTAAACGFVFYMDPKVAVGTIIKDAGQRLLLIRRAIEPGYGLWVFPGGYVDRGEAVTAAAIREAREEAGRLLRFRCDLLRRQHDQFRDHFPLRVRALDHDQYQV